MQKYGQAEGLCLSVLHALQQELEESMAARPSSALAYKATTEDYCKPCVCSAYDSAIQAGKIYSLLKVTTLWCQRSILGVSVTGRVQQLLPIAGYGNASNGVYVFST